MILAALKVFFLLTPAFGAYVFPDDFKLCGRSSTNLSKCLLSSLQDALPKLADPGISSPIKLKTEPMFAPYCEYHPRDSLIKYDEYFHNLTHEGFINSTVLEASANAENLAFNFTIFTPHFVQISNYTANGTLLYNGTQDPVEVWGTGVSVKNLYNVTIFHQLKSEKVEKNGETYLKVVSYNISVALDDITFNYGNLYNGTKPELAVVAANYLNKYAMNLVAGIKKDIEAFFADMFKHYLNWIIGSVPISKLIPN